MFIEVKTTDGRKTAINLMQVQNIIVDPVSGQANIAFQGASDDYIPTAEPYEALIERLSECCPGMNGHFRAPA